MDEKTSYGFVGKPAFEQLSETIETMLQLIINQGKIILAHEQRIQALENKGARYGGPRLG